MESIFPRNFAFSVLFPSLGFLYVDRVILKKEYIYATWWLIPVIVYPFIFWLLISYGGNFDGAPLQHFILLRMTAIVYLVLWISETTSKVVGSGRNSSGPWVSESAFWSKLVLAISYPFVIGWIGYQLLFPQQVFVYELFPWSLGAVLVVALLIVLSCLPLTSMPIGKLVFALAAVLPVVGINGLGFFQARRVWKGIFALLFSVIWLAYIVYQFQFDDPTVAHLYGREDTQPLIFNILFYLGINIYFFIWVKGAETASLADGMGK